MDLALASQAESGHTGLRQIDLRKDLRAIADLIEEAFGEELDSSGRSALREMHTLSRLGPVLYLMVPTGGELGGFFRGFVWEVNGQVVGNITIQQVDGYGQRWMIANVAVHKPFRGRGIGRSLMEAALDRIRQLGGEWALLQVRRDNAVARGLYERLGFGDVVAETALRSFTLPPAVAYSLPAGVQFRPLYDEHWRHIQYLLRQSMPELARWWQPQRCGGYRTNTSSLIGKYWGQISGQGYRQRLGAWEGNDLMGVLDVDVSPQSEHHIDLLLHPQRRGQWEAPLLAHGLSTLANQPPHPVTATLFDYQPHAIETLKALGFRQTNVLVTMRKRIERLSERYR